MITLRFYEDADQDAVLELWQRAWEKTFSDIDFHERLETTFGQYWRAVIIPSAEIILAEEQGTVAGVVTIDPKTHYLDQLFVAPEYWGSTVAEVLLTEARRLSPSGVDLKVNARNHRAVRFYEKHGFVKIASSDADSRVSVDTMQWRP